MKRISLIILAVMVFGPAALTAQESTEAGWEFSPSVSYVYFFPGDRITGTTIGSPVRPMTFAPIYQEFRYSGNGLAVNVRAFVPSTPNLAATFGVGVNWFHFPEIVSYTSPVEAEAGIGEIQHNREFMTFPLSAGLQVVYPAARKDALMFFAGGEGNLHFVSGDVDINQQAKLGYSILGGLALRMFEFGIRYTAFSDMRNLGVHLGLRFSSFTL